MHVSRRRLALAILIALAVPQAVPACGDKLIVLGRGVRFERIVESKYPGSIVLYLNPRSRLPEAEQQFHLAAVLQLAGHAVATVESRAELDQSLREKRPDLVLADIVDARSLSEELAASSSPPALVPVLFNPTAGEVAEAERQASCFGQAAKKKRRHLLRTVEDVLERRSKGLPTGCEEVGARRGR